MPSYVNILNKVLSLGTILLQVVVLLLAINLIFFRKGSNRVLTFFKNQTMLFGFLAGLGAVTLSLFYSEIVGYPPCELCWVQRIFLYPQLVLFGLGLIKKDKSILDYSLTLAILGSLTSIYHIYVENGGSSSLTCVDPRAVATSSQISCTVRYVFEFGYITIPVMCLTLSLFIILLILSHKYNITKTV